MAQLKQMINKNKFLYYRNIDSLSIFYFIVQQNYV